MTQVIHDIQTWRTLRTSSALQNKTIGFIPTMGALHAGHLSLIEAAKRDNAVVIVSIFVNPTQFNNAEDLQKYPRTFEQDLQLLEAAQVDYLFAPPFAEMYPDQYNYKIAEKQLSQELCGASRPGHFDGVLTVVMKLFQLVQATRAYFGEKDYQQLSLIREMVRAFFLEIEICACPTVREADGLAMSSRNVRLSEAGRKKAAFFARTFLTTQSLKKIHSTLQQEGIEIDYLAEHDGRRFAAVLIDNVRLIDNVKI
jgi:pantoate--beta-alanine ligase